MTPTQYWRAFARFWWLIALCAAVGVVVSVIITRVPVDYTSASTVLVSSRQ